MIKFTSYQKIPEVSTNWGLDAQAIRQLQRVDWCVMEKIHGANFCWIASESEITCAKRKAVLTPEDEFFHYRLIKERSLISIRQIFDKIAAFKAIEYVYVYGEIFGGGYPHPKVPLDSRLQPVQTGVYYSPTIEFCAFDIATCVDDCFEYLDYSTAIALFEQSSLFYSKPLFVGKMQEAMNYPIEFTTTIPTLLSLPPLDVSNMAEGVVIKPMRSLKYQTAKGVIRPILKMKTKAFSEDARYHQAKKCKDQVEGGQGDYLLTELEWDITMLVTQNRLSNAVSKVGHLTAHTRAEIKQLLKEDVEEELAQKYGDRLSTLTDEEQELVVYVLFEKIDEVMRQIQPGVS
jgi:Rnl2 family RNA ligase